MAKRRYKILIVEDNEINREILNEILCADFDLLVAENGQEGLEQMRKHTAGIDLVLLDINMPVMDGYQMLEEVSKSPLLKEIPIVVTTSNTDTEDEVRCLQMGACDFVTKPYNPMVVRLRVERVIELRESVASNLQKMTFIHNMRHEIRTPLNAIVGFAQVLAMPGNQLGDDDRAEYASYIMNNSDLLTRMVDDLLALSDMDNGMVVVNKAATHPNEVCHNTLKTTQFLHPEGVKVYLTSDVADDYTVTTDESRLQQALTNLIANACKFTQQGEVRLHVSDTEIPGMVTFSVADTGCGIDPEMADEIFKRFVKLQSEKPGNGLGLSIVSNIAHMLEGRTCLDTTYSQGARFIFAIKQDC